MIKIIALLFMVGTLYSQQVLKVLWVWDNGDTTDFSLIHNSGPLAPEGLGVSADSGCVAIKVHEVHDEQDNYKITFTNYTLEAVDNFYLEIPENKRWFDIVWTDPGMAGLTDAVCFPDIKGSEDDTTSKVLRFILNKPLSTGESWYCHFDVDYGDHSQLIGGFYIGDKLYKETFSDSCYVYSETKHRIIWTPNNELDIDGYKVYIGTASRIYNLPFQTIERNEIGFDLSFLEIGTYYIAVTAFNKKGEESGYSNELIYIKE